ncbi:MAG: hypothetical protein JSS45_07730 [Proteobacteria bacterium]|nr:hypothetical protein [Pseudomonadota bacterium]
MAPNQSISLTLNRDGQSEPEIVYVNRANGKWRSPGEGWLGPQNGFWTQAPEGLYLMDPDRKKELAFCKGLKFDTCYTLDSGKSSYRSGEGHGVWQVLGVFQAPASNV